MEEHHKELIHGKIDQKIIYFLKFQKYIEFEAENISSVERMKWTEMKSEMGRFVREFNSSKFKEL